MTDLTDKRATLDHACEIVTAALAAMDALHADEQEAERMLRSLASDLGMPVESPAPSTHTTDIDAFVAEPVASVCVRAAFRTLVREGVRLQEVSVSRDRFMELLESGEAVDRVGERTGLTEKDAAIALRLTGRALLDTGFFDAPREIAVRGRSFVVRTTASGLYVESTLQHVVASE